MDRFPLVSVIIPTYNQAAFIGAAVGSALSQDYPNLEVVVSDDCSTDGTAELMKRFSDPRLRYEPSGVNLGRTANYRRGLYELARGEWVLNLDGDDFLADDTFIRAAVAAAEDRAVLVFADRFVGDENADPDGFRSAAAASVTPRYLDGTEYVLSLPRAKLRMHHLCVLYNRKEALPIGFYRADIVSCDYESIFRLVLGRTIAHIPARVAVWRKHPGNASRIHDAELSVENFRLFQSVRDFAAERLGAGYVRRFDAWLRRNLANRYYGFLLRYLRAGEFDVLRRIDGFMRSAYPEARREALRNPKVLARGLVALLSGVASRAAAGLGKKARRVAGGPD